MGDSHSVGPGVSNRRRGVKAFLGLGCCLEMIHRGQGASADGATVILAFPKRHLDKQDGTIKGGFYVAQVGILAEENPSFEVPARFGIPLVGYHMEGAMVLDAQGESVGGEAGEGDVQCVPGCVVLDFETCPGWFGTFF